MITQELVKHLFNYKDGILTWKHLNTAKVKPGDKAGCVISDGYERIMINLKVYRTHRLVYLYHHGYLPKMIDHIDGNKLNNKIENLRECTLYENNRNARTPITNTSGAKNVTWYKRLGKWRVALHTNGKLKHIGYFEDFELAELVAIEVRNKFHGSFARHD